MSGIPAETLRYQIWNNPKNDSSLRLTMHGFDFVTRGLKLTNYRFELEEPLTNKNLLQLEKHFQGMYFLLKNRSFFAFDEDEASMLVLMNSNLKNYLENLENTT